MDLSLFYFGSDDGRVADRYRLLLDGARMADEAGFIAVWTPERHFGVFGGSFPNPAVTGAAIAAVTERVHIRAGSVVAPLHHPVRIAEEWSVVDNLSHGRVGISLASGWHARDFALRPDAFPARRETLAETVRCVRELWSGGSLTLPDGTGRPSTVELHPRPVSPELPMWLTAGGSRSTFEAAGRLRLGLLTHLLGQEIDQLAENIAAYRAAWQPGGAGAPHVVCMMHAFLGPDRESVRDTIRGPFTDYLVQSFDLLAKSSAFAESGDASLLEPAEIRFMIERSFDRYVADSGLFGTVDDAVGILGRLGEIGVDEVACLIDFGVSPAVVLEHLPRLAELRGRI